MITAQNYNQQKQNIDWSKLPKEVAALKDDVDFSIEFYNDDDAIKETIDLFLKAVNKASVSEPKKATVKEIAKASNNIHIVKPSHGKTPVLTISDERKQQFENGAILRENIINGTKIQLVVKGKKIQFVVDGKGKDIGEYEDMNEKYEAHQSTLQNITNVRKSTRTLISSLPFVKLFMPDHQQKMLMQQNSEELDGVLQDLEASLKAIPTKEQGENIMNSTVYAHYFYGGSDWYILDYSKSKQLFFGYVVLNGDTQMSEAGYISPAELKETGKVELDFYFTPKKLADILVKKYPGEFPNLENPPKKAENPPKKTQKPPIEKKVDTKQVDRFTKEFMLIRRFFNLVKKETVPFRSIHLLYMAFNKAAVGRDVRKTSEDAELFTEVNKKMTALFKIADVKKINTEIDFTDKTLLSKIENYVTGRKVNYAITLLKSFIGMQGTKPDVKKAENLLKRIDSAIDNNRIEKDNRLWSDIQEAKKELKAYIEKPTVKIEPEVYGLSFPKRSVCTNRIKCEGLRHDGKLKKGYKFNKKAEVIKVKPTPTRKKKVVSKKKNTPKQLGTVLIDVSTPTPQTVIANEGAVTVATLEQNQPMQDTKQAAQPTKTTQKIKNKLMNMTFDTIEMDEGWEDFMQHPAANMKMAIYGKPKNGKTSGALKLAKYLSTKGNLLYNFADQGFNKSTQDLWRISGLANVPNAEPSDISTLDDLETEIKKGKYRFVFIDMINDYINRENISPQEFKDRFIKGYPNTSFILVFEVTKGGDFKGDQGWTHIVDAIVTVDSFLMENRGRYGVGHHVIWEEGLKRFNPKKYEEIYEQTASFPNEVTI